MTGRENIARKGATSLPNKPPARNEVWGPLAIDILQRLKPDGEPDWGLVNRIDQKVLQAIIDEPMAETLVVLATFLEQGIRGLDQMSRNPFVREKDIRKLAAKQRFKDAND